MAITMKYNTYKVYPRVYYFQQFLLNLYERFVNLTGCFKESYHDEDWLEVIKKGVERYKKHPFFQTKTQNNVQFDLQRVLLYTRQTTVKTARSDECGMEICVCYLVIDPSDETRINNDIQEILLPFFKTKCHDGNSCETFFVLCDLEPTTSSDYIAGLRSHIEGEMKKVNPNWQGQNRLVICTDKNDKAAAQMISKTLETDLEDLFATMFEYLQRFTGSHETQQSTGSLLKKNGHISDIILRFVSDIESLNDMRNIHEISDNEGADESTEETVQMFVKVAADQLSRNVCQGLIGSLLDKYNLKQWLTDIMLNEDKLQDKVSEALNNSQTVTEHFKTLEKQSKKMYVVELQKSRNEANFKDTASNVDDDDDDGMIKAIIDGLQHQFLEFEKNVKQKLEIIHEMKRMRYEIEGYRRELLVHPPPRTDPTLSKPLAEDINRLNSDLVRGVGIFYGILQIHVKDQQWKSVRKLRKNLQTVMKKHQYWFPYRLCIVKKEATQLMHATGGQLRGVFEDGENRCGTLGAFMQCDAGQLYTVTTAHTVARGNNTNTVLADTVSLTANGVDTRIGIAEENTTFNTLIDIAAIKVTEILQECNISRYLKHFDGSDCNGRIFRYEPNRAHTDCRTVYKYGAQTGQTVGIIASMEFVDFVNHVSLTDCLLVIENLPNAPGMEQAFANCGDSGSLVCAPIDNEPDFVNILSMLTCGDLHLRQHEYVDLSRIHFSVMFYRGLQAIQKAAKVNLSLYDTLPDPDLEMS